jgi:DNA polymerase-3 subunit gamma/tau
VKRLVESESADDLTRLYHGFSQGFDEVVKSERPRAALEMLLVRLARRPPLLPIDDLVSRLAALERRLGGAPAAQPQQPPRPAPQPRPAQDTSSAPQPGRAGRPRESRPPPTAKASGDDRDGEPAGSPRAVAAPEAQDAAELDQIYTQILAILEADRPDLAAMLGHAIPLRLLPDGVVVGWPPDSTLVASDKESVGALARAAERHFGKPCAVSFEFDSERAKGRKSLAAADSQERADRTRAAYAAAQRHERITEAVEILGAKLKELKLGGVA